jgi:ABC-2 type transport system ATP-binding protein
MSHNAIQVAGLTKSYGDNLAVDSLDVEVATGSVLGFLGPNGAGKTTVIRILSTILDPDRGSFSVAGIPSTSPVAIRERIGVLPESAGYPREQTAIEWLTFHGELFNRPRRLARSMAESLLAEVGLTERAGSLISGYSRGMRQRLGIARALVNDPHVVFLDEPTLGLDPSGQMTVLELVSRIARQKQVTVVLSSHLLAEVEQVCDRVLILNRGRVVAKGTVAEVVRLAAAPREGRVQVPGDLAGRAADVLATAGLRATSTPDQVPGYLTVSLNAGESPEQSAASALKALLEAGVPVLGFTIEGGRLSDAFLALTGQP